MEIPFNKPYLTGNELPYISQAHTNRHLAGSGLFTKKCCKWLEDHIGCHKALLTHSCTAALEMAAMLIDVRPGDEIIMPSYTFVSTANAFVLRGGVPIFIDIRPDTLNIDESKIEAAITSKTKAIVPVHYAGVACEMDTIMEIARRHGLFVIEDAAQGVMSSYKGRALGSIGHLAALSFHETKNIISGEGGALLINSPEFAERAEILWEKGTDRGRFFRGQVDKYTWVDIGSSYLPGEIIAAFLWAQMEQAEDITARRMKAWDAYHAAFADVEQQSLLRRPIVPSECQHNAHMYYLLLQDLSQRSDMLAKLKAQGINAVFHYVPLHNATAGKRFGRAHADMSVTVSASDRLLRLPLWVELEQSEVNMVISVVKRALSQGRSSEKSAHLANQHV